MSDAHVECCGGLRVPCFYLVIFLSKQEISPGNYRTFRHVAAFRRHKGGNDEAPPSARMISDIEGTSSAIARDERRGYVGSCCVVEWVENHSPATGI